MSKVVYLSAGHGGSDVGAVKYVTEKDVNLKMCLYCADYLTANGVTVVLARKTDVDTDLNEIVDQINTLNPDLAIDIHNNAGGGDGFEAYHSVYGGAGKTLCENIEAEVLAIGQNSRGIKTRMNANGKDYYGFIRGTVCPAVILEGAFVDHRADSSQIDEEHEQKAFGEAYARGILKTLGIKDKLVDSKLYRVQVGAFRKRENAENLKAKLVSEGYEAFIV